MTELAPGKYVVAVSGGVDSMVLLHMLMRRPALELVVAHVDHGIRADAAQDEALVRRFAAQHNLPFYTVRLQLGEGASEAAARAARYEFLQQCSKRVNALGVVVAHHQDDVIETALLAIVRGTGWRGIAPFMDNTLYKRPLLQTPKHRLIGYARVHNVPWREDSTNINEAYTRNYIRHTLMPMLDQKSDSWRAAFLQIICKQQVIRPKIERQLAQWLNGHAQRTANGVCVRRYDIIMLPQPVAYELMQQVFRSYTGHSFERHIAEAAVLFAQVARPKKLLQLNRNWQLRAESANVIVEPRNSVLSLNKQ